MKHLILLPLFLWFGGLAQAQSNPDFVVSFIENSFLADVNVHSVEYTRSL